VTILAPGFADSAVQAVGDWMPSRYTPSLTGGEDFTTQGDKLLTFAERHWSIAETDQLQLDAWQRWLTRHVLETYPPDWPVVHLRGQLRFRQVVISMGRQNGKSLLGALFVLYFLALHVRGPNVIGLASIDAQAKIVYKRVKYGIDNSPALCRELKTTNTRGITRRDGSGQYFTLPAKEDSAQGEPASGALYDELHLGLKALWDAMVLAQRARRNSLLIGITTAGDEGSELLIKLYEEGDAAIAGHDERFGFFCWEAIDRELTEANVIRANPAIACGRVPLDVAMHDAQKMWNDTKVGKDGLTGRQRAIRYTLNLFIEGIAGGWVPLHSWTALQGQPEIVSDVTYGIERTPSWEHAFITATTKHDDVLHTEPVATIVAPTPDQLKAIAKLLNANTPGGATFAMDALTLGRVADELKEDGLEVWKLGASEVAAAAQLTAGRIESRQLVQSGNELLRRQMGRARRRDTGDGWRVSRSLSAGEVDGVIATLASCYVADQKAPAGTQLW
jgi:phage terminase large subunit-like protein